MANCSTLNGNDRVGGSPVNAHTNSTESLTVDGRRTQSIHGARRVAGIHQHQMGQDFQAGHCQTPFRRRQANKDPPRIWLMFQLSGALLQKTPFKGAEHDESARHTLRIRVSLERIQQGERNKANETTRSLQLGRGAKYGYGTLRSSV